MTLISILLALIVEHFASRFRDRQLWGLRGGVVARLRNRLSWGWLWRSRLWLVVLLLGPTAAVEVIRVILPSDELQMLWGAAVLFACLGPKDLADSIHALRKAGKTGDTARAAAISWALKSGPDPHAQSESLFSALFTQSHERLFGPLIWFMVCGPAGALFYRLAGRAPWVYTSADGNVADAADRIHVVAAWIPVRLTAILFGLAGSVDAALQTWRKLPHTNTWRRTWQILGTVPAAALSFETGHALYVPPNLDATLAEVLRMQRRAMIIAIAVFALYTAGGWLT